ncbi:MAG: PA14 domain-containing protein [Fimbriimonadaceae bacterium]|nr:PA14 domain-containing protein [Fimbriimonadaceae bacterium]
MLQKRAALAMVAAVGLAGLGDAQMVTGSDMPGFAEAFSLPAQASGIRVRLLEASTGTNVLWPGEQATLTLRLDNLTERTMSVRGRVDVIGFRTEIPPDDIWTPHVHRVSAERQDAFQAELAPRGGTEIKVRPRLPERFGSYGVVLDFGQEGRAFAASLARVVRAEAGRVFIPQYAIDLPWPHENSVPVNQTFQKLGVKGARMEASFTPLSAPNFEERMADLGRRLQWAWDHNVTVMLTLGAGQADMPLGRGRPWLTPDDTLIEGVKEDLAWLPRHDPEFQEWVREVLLRWGWPNGPVNAVELWNEPWEGVSISGWGADMIRYREIYRRMAAGVLEARAQGRRVLIGGTSSSSNTLDKLFPDDSKEFLPILDFVSIHYQGVGAIPGLVPMWTDRTGEYGPVQNWDTESWVANADGRVPGVVASMLSFGQQRAMGTYGGNTYQAVAERVDGREYRAVNAWALAPAVAAAARHIGQRRFGGLIFGKGLPWAYRFDDAENPDDGTLVILGDMGVIYPRNDQWFRTSQAALVGSPGRLEIAADPAFRMLDHNGNIVPPQAGSLRIPLSSTAVYVRTDGSKGSFERLVKAVQAGRISGYPPVEITAKDMTGRVGSDGGVEVTLTNLMNRPISGRLSVQVNGTRLPERRVQLQPHSSERIALPTAGLAEDPDNLYRLQATFDAGGDGEARHAETMRVNLIARRTISVDGNPDDWNGVLPQTLTAEGIRPSLTETAWLPFKDLAQGEGAAFSSARLAHDDQGIYFLAETLDPTPWAGGIRFAERDDDSYFYPAVSYETGRNRSPSFAARFVGTITAPADGSFRFWTLSDDGVRLRVNGRTLIDNWTDHGPTWDFGLVELRRGEAVPIEIDYYQGGGGAELRLEWEGPGLARSLVPAAAMKTPTGEPGLMGEYFRNRDFTDPKGRAAAETIDFATNRGFPPEGVMGPPERRPMVWPEGVRRFSYRRDPDLPSGSGTDNILIAFNAVPLEREWLKSHPPGTFPTYMAYACTDYEFALNQVAETHGGGTEIWRLLAPGMPRKHFYPRQPRAQVDGGPVTEGRLVIRRQGDRRITEAFIPWSEIPDVRRLRDEGKTVRFSFRVNDSNGPSYELAQGRSVSKQNFLAFHPDWVTHWANEIEFAFEEPPRSR